MQQKRQDISPNLQAKLQTMAGSSKPIAALKNQELADALEAGFLRQDADGRFHLTQLALQRFHACSQRIRKPGTRHSANGQARQRASRGRQATRRQAETPLEWLAKRKDKTGQPVLQPDHYRAANRLAGDFQRAHMMPRTTMAWNAQPVAPSSVRFGQAGPGLETDAGVAARERVCRALEAVGPELSGVLIDVCCFEKGLEETERSAGWPARSGKIILRLALESLARHYGITTSLDRGTRKMRHWGASDYKPLFDAPASVANIGGAKTD